MSVEDLAVAVALVFVLILCMAIVALEHNPPPAGPVEATADAFEVQLAGIARAHRRMRRARLLRSAWLGLVFGAVAVALVALVRWLA